MIDEPTLFDTDPTTWVNKYIREQSTIDRYKTLDEQFEEYHRQNPHVLDALIRLTDEAIATGRKHIGISLLVGRLRWETFISTSGDEYKMNNNYNSRYVRLIEQVRPDLVGVFHKRELKS